MFDESYVSELIRQLRYAVASIVNIERKFSDAPINEDMWREILDDMGIKFPDDIIEKYNEFDSRR